MSNNTPPSRDPKTQDQQIGPDVNEYRTRIRRAINKLRGSVRTGIQHTLDFYSSIVAPELATSGESRFPKSMKPHPRDAGKSQVDRFEHLLYFTVGRAILSYFDSLRGDTKRLKKDVEHLEAVAKSPMDFRIRGDDAHGYHLVHKDDK